MQPFTVLLKTTSSIYLKKNYPRDKSTLLKQQSHERKWKGEVTWNRQGGWGIWKEQAWWWSPGKTVGGKTSLWLKKKNRQKINRIGKEQQDPRWVFLFCLLHLPPPINWREGHGRCREKRMGDAMTVPHRDRERTCTSHAPPTPWRGTHLSVLLFIWTLPYTVYVVTDHKKDYLLCMAACLFFIHWGKGHIIYFLYLSYKGLKTLIIKVINKAPLTTENGCIPIL